MYLLYYLTFDVCAPPFLAQKLHIAAEPFVVEAQALAFADSPAYMEHVFVSSVRDSVSCDVHLTCCPEA